MSYFFLALDCPMGGSSRKALTHVRGNEFFFPTKFRKYPSSDSVVKADYGRLHLELE